jgi:hypothetical protein
MPRHLIDTDLNNYYTKAQVDAISFQAGGGLNTTQVNALIQAGCGVIDVKDYGAAPNTGTDQTTFFNNALQAAINYPSSSGRKTNIVVVSEAGLYEFDDMIWVGRPEVAFSTVAFIALPSRPYDKQTGAMNGVTLKSRSYTKPLIGVQAVRDAVIRGFNLEGMNMTTQSGAGYGANNPANWISSTMLSNNPNCDSQNNAQALVVVDPYSGNGTITNPIDGTAHSAAYSSGVRFEICNFRNSVIGAGIQIYGMADGNGDFCSFHNCTFKAVKWGISCANSQSRQLNTVDCLFDCYFALADCVHGKQQGRFNNSTRDHISGYGWFMFGDMARTESFSANDCYAESLQVIGKAGGGSGSGYPHLRDCKISLSHQQSTYLPPYIFWGNKIKITGGKLSTAVPDMFTTGLNVIQDVDVQIIREGVNQAYGNVLSRDFNTISDAQKRIWNRSYENTPFMLGSVMGGRVINCQVTFGDTDWIVGEDKAGTMFYKQPKLVSVQTGTSGVLGDYWWKSKSNAATALANRSLVGNLLKFSTDGNIGWNDYFTPTVMKPGDSIYVLKNDQAARFMIARKGTRDSGTGLVVPSSNYTGQDFDCVLIGGYEFDGTTGAFYRYVGIDPTTLFTDTPGNVCTVFWISANHHDTRPIKGTATAGSPIITGIDWGLAADDNASQPGGPTGQFEQGDILYAYQTTNSILPVPVSNVQVLRVNSIDSTSQITVNANLNFSGANTLLFSRWPFERKN